MAGDIIGVSRVKDNEDGNVTGVGGSASTSIVGERSSVFFNNDMDGVPRNSDLFSIRVLGQTTQIQLVKDRIKNQVASTEFDVKPVSGEEEETTDEQLQAAQEIESFLKGGFNSDPQSFDDLLKILLDDILDFDSGVLELVGDDQGNLQEIIPHDGLTFTKNVLDNGKLPEPGSEKPAYYQFSLSTFAKNIFSSRRQGIDFRELRDEIQSLPFSRIFNREQKEFSRSQIVWFQESPVSHSPYGIGKTEKVKRAAEIVINGDAHRNRFFQDNEFHKGVMSVSNNLSQKDKKALKQRFKESSGNEYEMPVIGGADDIEYVQIDPEPEAMQFLESQKYYNKLVVAAYGLNDVEVGFLENANKGISDDAKRKIFRQTTQPLLHMIERKFNNEILPKMEAYKRVDGQLKFEFQPQNMFMRALENDLIQDELGNQTLTVNEARRRKGKEGYGEIGELPKQVFEEYVRSHPGFVVEEITDLEDVPERQEEPNQFFESYNTNNDDDDNDKGQGQRVRSKSGGRSISEARKVNKTGKQVSEESEKNVEDVDLTPPETVKNAARTALEKKQEFSDEVGDCGTGVGESRAEKIVDEDLSPEDFLGGENTAIPDYLDSHSEDVNGLNKPISEWDDEDWTGRSVSSDGSPRCGPVQYALWGGTSTGTGLEWAESTEQELKQAQEQEEQGEEDSFTEVNSYQKAFEHKEKVLDSTKDALRNQHGFDDVDGIVNHKDELKEDVAKVFKQIDIADAVEREFPEQSLDDGVVVDLDKIVGQIDFADRLASELETSNLDALEMASQSHAESLESELENRAVMPSECKIEISFDVLDTFTSEVIREEALKNATQIMGTVKDRLRNELLEASEQGEGIPKVKQRVQDTVDGLSDSEAELVARTETLQSSRKGSQALAESSDIVQGKEWIATNDNRTREWHNAMDGTVIPKDEQYTVPKVSGDQPNDYPRSARVVGEDQPFNCRCSQAPVLEEDLPDSVLEASAQFDSLELKTRDLSKKMIEIYVDEDPRQDSFKQYLQDLFDRHGKSKAADKLEVSSRTPYDWSTKLGF